MPDKRLQSVGVTWLKIASADHLRRLEEPLVVVCHSTPVAAIVPYELFQKWQRQVATFDALLEATEEFAFDSCQQLCVHGRPDADKACPTNDERIEAARKAKA